MRTRRISGSTDSSRAHRGRLPVEGTRRISSSSSSVRRPRPAAISTRAFPDRSACSSSRRFSTPRSTRTRSRCATAAFSSSMQHGGRTGPDERVEDTPRPRAGPDWRLASPISVRDGFRGGRGRDRASLLHQMQGIVDTEGKDSAKCGLHETGRHDHCEHRKLERYAHADQPTMPCLFAKDSSRPMVFTLHRSSRTM